MDRCEFEASLVYTASSRPARAGCVVISCLNKPTKSHSVTVLVSHVPWLDWRLLDDRDFEFFIRQ